MRLVFCLVFVVSGSGSVGVLVGIVPIWGVHLGQKLWAVLGADDGALHLPPRPAWKPTMGSTKTTVLLERVYVAFLALERVPLWGPLGV